MSGPLGIDTDSDGWEPLGNEHWFRRFHASNNLSVEIGVVILHRNPVTQEPCWGSVMYDIPEAQRYRTIRRKDGSLSHVWTLHSLDPLHVEPSVQCSAPSGPGGSQCGDHGFIRNGRWEPA